LKNIHYAQDVLIHIAGITIIKKAEDMLQVKDDLQPSDVIYVLAGGDGSRKKRAAALYKQKYAPLIVNFRAVTRVLRYSVHMEKLSCAHLQRAGIPSQVIVTLPEVVRNTWDEAIQFAKFAEERRIRTALLVSDP